MAAAGGYRRRRARLQLEGVDGVEREREQVDHGLDTVGIGQRPVHLAGLEAVGAALDDEQQAALRQAEAHIVDVVTPVEGGEHAPRLGIELLAGGPGVGGVHDVGAVEDGIAERRFPPLFIEGPRPSIRAATPPADR